MSPYNTIQYLHVTYYNYWSFAHMWLWRIVFLNNRWEIRRASHCKTCITTHCWSTLDSFSNTTTKQINKAFWLVFVSSMQHQYPNALMSKALNFIYIDFSVSGAKFYSIKFFFPLTSAFSEYLCTQLTDRQLSRSATRKGGIISRTIRHLIWQFYLNICSASCHLWSYWSYLCREMFVAATL